MFSLKAVLVDVPCKDLIEKIEKFLSLSFERRRDMGLAGRTKVEREFDRQIVVRKYLEETEKVGK